MDAAAIDATLTSFFAAIERGDIGAVAELYADDIEVWHNVTKTTIDKAANLDLLRYWSSAVEGLRYEIVERNAYEGGAVQRHVVHGTAKGGELAADIGIVFRLADGKITHIWEYLDSAAVAAVFGAV